MGPQKFKVSGRIEQIDLNTVEITEIPVKTWTNNVKEFCSVGLGMKRPSHGLKIWKSTILHLSGLLSN